MGLDFAAYLATGTNPIVFFVYFMFFFRICIIYTEMTFFEFLRV
jgi:hypothetical protein